MLSAAGGRPSKVRLPDRPPASPMIDTVQGSWPAYAIGRRLEDPALRAMVHGPECWCDPVARAVVGEGGEVVLLVSTRDSDVADAVSVSGDRWNSLTTWTPQQARLLAGQLLLAARAAERGE